jgi:energy-coupling factor transporter ATP-binding protein EcfA2
MRVVDIWPQQFGKRLSRLQFPETDFVVIFGKNGTGKSTYADLLVALLLKNYDTALMSRHGKPGEQVRGEVNLARGTDAIRIEFEAEATVPKRSTETRRKTSNPRSDLWASIEGQIESEVIRNIYRVDSIEIVASLQNELKEEGVAALKKRFKNYASGDKRGVNYTAIIDTYRQRAKSLIDADSQVLRGRDATKLIHDKIVEERAIAETSQTAVKGHESAEARLNHEIAELEEKAEDLDRQQRALDFAGPLQDADKTGKEAQREVDRLKREGLLISERFSSIVTSLTEESKRLTTLAESRAREDIALQTRTLAEKRASIDRQVIELGIKGDVAALSKRILAHNDRNNDFAELNTAIERRSTQRTEIDRINIVEAREKLAAQVADLAALEERWSRLRVQDASNQPIDPAELWKSEAINATVSQQSSASSFEQAALIVAAAAALGLGFASDSAVARFGGILVALILGGLTAKSLLRKAKKTDGERAVDGDAVDAARDLANQLLQARKARDDLSKDLAVREVRVTEANRLHDEAAAKVKQILSSWGLRENPGLTTAEAVAYKTAFDRLASELSDESSIKVKLAAAESQVKSDEEEFKRISTQVGNVLKTVSIHVDLAAEGSPRAAVQRLESLIGEFNLQKKLREDIQNREKMIEQVPSNLKELIDHCLTMSEIERNDKRLTIESQSKTNLSEIGDRKNQLSMESTQRRLKLETARLPQLNEQIYSLKAEIESHERAAALKNLQATLLEQLSKKRQEDSTPELERRVAQISLVGAPEWKTVRRAEDETFLVAKDGVEVRDSELSSGELSVLFLAIRIAMIQQEDQRENALRLPLICDDPLLHLDETRTTSTFTMMVNELKGRQTLYFTFRPEIRDLARSLSVPVIDLDERKR